MLLQIHQNLNTSHQYSKNYIVFQSNNASITNYVFLHIKHFKFSNLPIFTIASLFLLTLSTRSSDSSVLSIPYVRTSLGKRAFSVIAPRLWNSLPPDTRNWLSLSTFRSKLKTHLFKLVHLLKLGWERIQGGTLEFSPILSIGLPPGFDSCFSFTFSSIEWYLVLDKGH